MATYERINAVVSLTLIGLALYFVLDFPRQVTTFLLFGSPVEIDSPRQWLMVVLLGGVAMAGTHAVIQAHPHLSTGRLAYLSTFWPLPGLLVILATQTLGLATTLGVWVVGLIVVGLLLWLTINTEFQQISPQPAVVFWPHIWRHFASYAIAVAFYVIIYQTRSRSALSATGVFLVSGLIGLTLLRHTPQKVGKSWLFACVIALGMGQITWALNYWRIGALNAGLLLLLIFYLLVSAAQHQLRGTLSRHLLWEFGAIALVALIVIFNL